MQNNSNHIKRNECINEIQELLEEIKTLCNKNTLSIKNLKKYNIRNIETKITELQQESARYISISISDLRKVPFLKLEKIKNKCLTHIDKLLNQDLYLQQLSSKCSFLQENCTIKEESENESQGSDDSETLTTLMKNSDSNISTANIEEKPSSEEEIENEKEFNDETESSDSRNNQKTKKKYIDKEEYDNLFNEHMKALETIKELKRKIVQKHEEENLLRFNNNNNSRKTQDQKENYKIPYNNSSFKNQANQIISKGTTAKHTKTNSQSTIIIPESLTNIYTSKSLYSNNNNKQLWNYIFGLQNHLLDELNYYENQKKNLLKTIDNQTHHIKQLMKEKIENDNLKGYSSLGKYMEIMDSQEIFELMKGAKEYKSSINMKKRIDELQKDNSQKIEKLMKEKSELEEENYTLKEEIESSRNQSFFIKKSQENENEKNNRMHQLEKEKIEIERNLLEIERNKLKTEKEELIRLRELAKLSENRGYFIKK